MSTSHGAIVLGYGGSAHSKIALRWADRAATDLQRPLTVLVSVLDVAEIPGLSGGLAGARVVADLEELLGSAQAPSVTLRTVLTAPGPALVSAAREAHSVVLGARTHGAFASMVTGSVSGHVLRHAHAPVVIAREPQDRDARRVVVGADDASGHRAALEYAFDYASQAAMALTVAHVAQHEGAPAEGVVRESVDLLAEKYSEVPVDIKVLAGAPAKVLADSSRDAALLVVGSHGRGALAGLLTGSVSQSLVQHAQCPVALVH